VVVVRAEETAVVARVEAMAAEARVAARVSEATGVGSALLAKADGMEGVDWAAKTEVGVRAVARAAEVTGVATEAAKEV
jgi:hypothetical protein